MDFNGERGESGKRAHKRPKKRRLQEEADTSAPAPAVRGVGPFIWHCVRVGVQSKRQRKSSGMSGAALVRHWFHARRGAQTARRIARKD